MDELKDQIEKTLRNLDRGEILMEDRVFLNHVLVQFETVVLWSEGMSFVDDVVAEMIGSTRELVEDGLV